MAQTLIVIGLIVDFVWRGTAAASAQMTSQAIYGVVPGVGFLAGLFLYHLIAAPYRLLKERLTTLEVGESSAVPQEPPARTLEDAERDYSQLGSAEKLVVDAFVVAGGCALLWDDLDLGSCRERTVTGVESLRSKGLLWESVTADLRETFVLDPILFAVAQENYKSPF